MATQIDNATYTKLDGVEHAVSHAKIGVDKLRVDPAYQRIDQMNNGLINQIGADFSDIKCGTLTVGKRDDGGLWIVDGMHRWNGAKKAKVRRLACMVFDSPGAAFEARVFSQMNKQRRQVSALSSWKSRECFGDTDVLAINDMLGKWRMIIGSGGTRHFRAAQAIESVYKCGVLPKVLAAIDAAFDNGTASRWKEMCSQAHFIHALCAILSNKSWHVSEDRLHSVLQRMSESAYRQLANERAGTSGNRGKRIAVSLIDIYYNRGLRSGKIDTYGDSNGSNSG